MHIYYVWVTFQKIFTIDIMNKTRLYGYVYDTDVDDILDIHKYLMKKHDIKHCLDFF